jgi:hypothetical protein
MSVVPRPEQKGNRKGSWMAIKQAELPEDIGYSLTQSTTARCSAGQSKYLQHLIATESAK